jgi:hypothetical protein
LLLLALGVLVLLLYRHFGMAALGTLEGVQRDGLPIGESAPAVQGVSAGGTAVTWAPEPGRSALLVFAASECAPCAAVLPAVGRVAASKNGRAPAVTALVAGSAEDAAQLARKFDLRFPCLAEGGGGAAARYRVRVTPFAFVIGPDGRILAKGLCSDPARLRDLLAVAGEDDAAAVLEPTIRLVPRDSVAAVDIEEVVP